MADILAPAWAAEPVRGGPHSQTWIYPWTPPRALAARATALHSTRSKILLDHRPLSILVVDDEPGIRRAISRALSRDGHAVTAAYDVPSAITVLEDSRFAAILTDMRMPGPSGLALVEEVERRSLPTCVILMSGSLEELDGSDPRIARLAGVVAKPFDLKTLRSLISAATGISG